MHTEIDLLSKQWTVLVLYVYVLWIFVAFLPLLNFIVVMPKDGQYSKHKTNLMIFFVLARRTLEKLLRIK